MTTERSPLTRERILGVALELADAGGLGSLSMRRIGKELGVEGMALYNHVANKDAILDGIVDMVLAEIPLPSMDGDWQEEMRKRAVAARVAFLRHPWAIELLESRTDNSSPNRLAYFDAVLGCLRAAGFSPAIAIRAFAIIDSFVYGFILQELSLPFDDSVSLDAVGEDLLRQMADAYPHLTEATIEAMRSGWDYAEVFDFALGLLFGSLEPLRES